MHRDDTAGESVGANRLIDIGAVHWPIKRHRAVKAVRRKSAVSQWSCGIPLDCAGRAWNGRKGGYFCRGTSLVDGDQLVRIEVRAWRSSMRCDR
jgi:hypothetical protein